MFRVQNSKIDSNHSVAKRIVEIALVVALFTSLALAYSVLQEYRSHAMLAPGSGSPTLDPRDVLQFVLCLVVSASLTFCIASLVWLQRRYLYSEECLRQVKMLAHDILASMDRGVVTADREGVVTSINSAGIDLLEVDVECIGQPLAAISTEVPLLGVYREVVDQASTLRDREFSVERRGRMLRLRVDGHVLKDDRNRPLGCVIYLRDITESVLVEDRMRRMERFINLGTLASGLHHEIKNPLTAMSIHIQLLAESLADGNVGESAEEFVGVLKSEVCRLNGVLESFGSFANLQRLVIQQTDALGVIEDAVRLIRPQAAEQGVDVQLVSPVNSLSAPIDPEKFEQALLNLLINALESMPEGGSLTVGVQTEGDWFRTLVIDTGKGIPPEVQRRLFQPYFSTKSRGSGMGLALSEKLISQHGGHIEYRTGPEGTTFEIAIPTGQSR